MTTLLQMEGWGFSKHVKAGCTLADDKYIFGLASHMYTL